MSWATGVSWATQASLLFQLSDIEIVACDDSLRCSFGENGLPDLPVLLIELHCNDGEIGEAELAEEIDGAIKKRGALRVNVKSASNHDIIIELEETGMAKGEQKGNRESKKPKKEKIKTIAAAPSQKAAGWQPTFGSGKKK